MKEIYNHETPGVVFTRPEIRKVDTGRKDGWQTVKDEVYVNVSYQQIQRDYTEKCTVCMEEFGYTKTFDRQL